MGWLTGQEIARQWDEGRICIKPYDVAQLNPNSYDYRLADKLKIILPNSTRDGVACIDPKLPMAFHEVTIPEEGYLLRVEHAYLGHTVERFGSDFYASLVTGKSSIGRLFVKNHACAGLIDQGFFNHITLEITAKMPTVVYPNMRFGQIFWFDVVGDCTLYSGKYIRGDNAGEPSRAYEMWKKDE